MTREQTERLIHERAHAVTEMRTMNDKSIAETRDFTPDEERQYEALSSKADRATRQLDSSGYPGLRFDARSVAAPVGAGPRRFAEETEDEFRNADGSVKPGAALAGEVRAVLSGGGIGDALTPPEQANYVLSALEARSVFLQARPVVVRTERGELTIPHERGETVDLANWTTEGDPITEGNPDGEGIAAIPRAVKALVTASNESVMDSEPALLEHLENRLLRALSLRADAGYFEGSGTSPSIQGLRAVTGTTQITTLGANGAAPVNLDPWAEALGTLVESNAEEERIAIFMAGRTWKTLLKLKDDTASSIKPLLVEQGVGPTGAVTRRLYGRPVFITNQLALNEARGTSTDASSSYVLDMSRVLVVHRLDGSLTVDTSAKFGSDSTQIRAVARTCLVVPDPEAVARIVGLRP